ncbi:hypothetical protein Golomagni_06939 [Golovinomyces magnicellulatus]|nr:hypothetical protein Golomagni_06939 [Golovinomyces magnicellulatus]
MPTLLGQRQSSRIVANDPCIGVTVLVVEPHCSTCSQGATSQRSTSPRFSKTMSTTSSLTMFTLNCPCGTPLARKNSTVCALSHTVSSTLDRRRCASNANATVLVDDTDLIMLCYSVESKDSLENVESKWVGEIADNCPGVKLVLVALKCDLREQGDEENEGEGSEAAPAEPAAETNENGQPRENKPLISYEQGLEVARRIGASRYLECSAMRNRGVNEAFTEAARVALTVKKEREESKCVIM